MKKYRLIKIYPCPIILGLNKIVILSDDKNHYEYWGDGLKPPYLLSKSEVENFPEFWEEIKECNVGDKVYAICDGKEFYGTFKEETEHYFMINLGNDSFVSLPKLHCAIVKRPTAKILKIYENKENIYVDALDRLIKMSEKTMNVTDEQIDELVLKFCAYDKEGGIGKYILFMEEYYKIVREWLKTL